MQLRTIATALTVAPLMLISCAALGQSLSQSLNTSSTSGGWGFATDLQSAASQCVVSFPQEHAPGQLIVSFSDRRLYHIVEPGRAISYPIAVPRREHRWQGTQLVTRKRVTTSWRPTAQTRREEPDLPRIFRGGAPENPLGARAIYLGKTLYRIHGTDAPWTIGSNVSRGCLRMHNEHVIELYNKVRPGMKVTATWQRYPTTSLGSGNTQPDALFTTPGCN